MYNTALVEFANFCNCVSGDFHHIHLHFERQEFDNFHKEVFKKYYEEAGEDYDSLAEWSIGFKKSVCNPNISCKEINYPYMTEEHITREIAIEKADNLIDQLVTGFNILLQSMDEDSAVMMGLANYLQTRLEYWSKELLYFNARRGVNT